VDIARGPVGSPKTGIPRAPNWSFTAKFDGEFASGAQTYAHRHAALYVVTKAAQSFGDLARDPTVKSSSAAYSPMSAIGP